MSLSCPARGVANSSRTIVKRAAWCRIMPSRNSRSNSTPLAAVRLSHLLRRQHAGHQRGTVLVMRMGVRQRLAARLQPHLHHLDFVELRDLDALGQQLHVVAARAGRQQRGHLDGLLVVPDHALHELDVGGRELDLGEVGGVGRAHRAPVLPGRARLNQSGAAGGRGCALRHARPATARAIGPRRPMIAISLQGYCRTAARLWDGQRDGRRRYDGSEMREWLLIGLSVLAACGSSGDAVTTPRRRRPPGGACWS